MIILKLLNLNPVVKGLESENNLFQHGINLHENAYFYIHGEVSEYKIKVKLTTLGVGKGV